MKAIVCERYGPPEVLQFTEVDTPTPKDHEVRIKVYATTVHRGDSRMRSFTIPGGVVPRLLARLLLGIRGPRNKILGQELAGEIEAVGDEVTRFTEGDQVFASTSLGGGAYAEYICLPEDGIIALKPANLTYAEAAAGLPTGAAHALRFLRRGKIQSGQRVLIYGASGSVGSYAVQLAKHFGADVTGVCSTPNVELVTSLGADTVLDYAHEDFTERGARYDIIFDAVDKIPTPNRHKALTAQGIFMSAHDNIGREKVDDLLFLKELAEAGKLKPVIDRTYSWEHIVEAHRYVDTGHKRGNVVITVNQNNTTSRNVAVDSGKLSRDEE